MKLHHNYFTAWALVLILNLGYFNFGQDTPAERCAAMGDGEICLNCVQYDSCTTGVLGSADGNQEGVIDCIHGQVCDLNISDGVCTSVSSVASPICYCNEEGCFTDPNDPYGYIRCTGKNTTGFLAPPEPCDYSSQQFDINTCQCDTVPCPACGWIGEDNSECPTYYHYCDDPTVTYRFECQEGLCFDEDECHCHAPYVTCPPCGKYLDPTITNGREYCYCQDDIVNDVCGAECIAGTVFNSTTCECTPLTV